MTRISITESSTFGCLVEEVGMLRHPVRATRVTGRRGETPVPKKTPGLAAASCLAATSREGVLWERGRQESAGGAQLPRIKACSDPSGGNPLLQTNQLSVSAGGQTPKFQEFHPLQRPCLLRARLRTRAPTMARLL